MYGEWVDAAGTLLRYIQHSVDLHSAHANCLIEAVAKEDTGAGAGYSGTGRLSGRNPSRVTGDDDDDRQSYEGEGVVADDEEY